MRVPWRPTMITLLTLLATWGCQPKEPPEPPVAPPAEDLSTWTVPTIVQPGPHKAPPQAVVRPVNLPAGPDEKVYKYMPGKAVEALVPMGLPLDIVLQPGEQVREIVDGDRAPAQEGQQHRRWEVKEGKDGSGADLRPHLFVTASEPGLTNGLVVTTTRRVYYITCKSVAKAAPRVLRWHYDTLSADQGTPEPAPEPPLLPLPDDPRLYHVGYEMNISQPAPAWVPRFIVDDGKKTYLIYPEVTLFDTVPLLRLIGPNGPQLVNALQFLNVVIVDQLLARAELRLGTGERAQVVTITRGKLRTIQCPGDAACPVWPAAAATLAGRPTS